MRCEKNVAVPMRVGDSLCANLFLPDGDGAWPVIITLGPYGKDIHVSQFMPSAWEHIQKRRPAITQASSCKHLVFETPDPEVWTRLGYAVLKIDSRGAGKSPGFLDVNSPSESRDLYDAIEWAAAQAWCTGKAGLLGISYYAAGQWAVAALRPPHLAAIIPWQGTPDFYRDRTRQDGVFAHGFLQSWWPRSVLRNQHGNAETPLVDLDTGERNTGPAALSDDELRANRTDYIADVLAHPMLDDWYRARIPDLSKIEIPALVVANWGGLGLHLRGTISGFLDIASRDKWLRVQTGSYFATFWSPENVAVQRRFFDRFLKGDHDAWTDVPRVEIEVRSAEDGVARTLTSDAWPIPDTRWWTLHLDAQAQRLADAPPAHEASFAYAALGAGARFTSAPVARDTVIAGPIALTVSMASDTTDLDLFATLQAFHPDGREITFLSAIDPKCPVSQGWLRASHRALEPESSFWRPIHGHREADPLTPGQPYELNVEIWPASVALPAGSTLVLILQGQDFAREDEPGPFKGSGFFTHESEVDRPRVVFGGRHTILTGPAHPARLLLPVLDD